MALESATQRLRTQTSLVRQALDEMSPQTDEATNWAMILDGYLDAIDLTMSIPLDVPLDLDAYLQPLADGIRHQLPNSVEEVRSLNASEIQARTRNIDEHLQAFVDGASDWIPSQVKARLTSELRDLRGQVFSLNTLEGAQRAQASAEEAAASAAHSELASAFEAWAQAEAKAAGRWTAAAIVALVLICIAGLVLVGNADGKIPVLTEIAKLAITLPIAAISAYSIRLAGQHRRNSHWAHITAVQLKSVRAFTEDVSDELREEVRRTLSLAVFRTPPVIGVEQSESPVDDLNQILDRVVEMTKAARR